MAIRDRIHRIASSVNRPSTTRPPHADNRPAAPLWVRGLTAGGRPIVLGVALLMCAPGEYHLAEAAGWRDPFTFGMPVVLSAYAGIAAAVASTRRPGDRGRWSAIIGACLALSLAMAAQVVSHLIDTGHVIANQPILISVTSLVPPAVVGHLLHLAATPPGTRDAEVSAMADTTSPAEAVAEPVVIERDDRQDGTETLALPPVPPLDAEDDSNGLLTSGEVARRYSVDPSTVRSWVANGRLTVHEKDTRGRNLFHPDALLTEVSR
ncbi:helix-turn-helix domain-containing protein [Streptomyces lunaelactis]|uniref:helix-turn-helix domain-containing protein n=1 Tax=Streptomyces lunaelactis TaxID=1535768 RepID=UPI0015856151|nr:helix-turn-helix domain-containing protein [Streptomyces lunaelactis]NUL03579.1 helix-turn-helix domain-containing protein [Streptomyces lunaelactis]